MIDSNKNETIARAISACPFEPKDPDEWAKFVATNASEPNADLVRFAISWVALMVFMAGERPITSVDLGIQSLAFARVEKSLALGLSGAATFMVAKIVWSFWVHGDKFALAWNQANSRTPEDLARATEQGGLINPSMRGSSC